MRFKTRTEEIRKAVEVLRPFVKEKVEDEDSIIISYDDKLNFEVHKDYIFLSVFTDDISICERIWAESNEDDVSFCFHFQDFFELIVETSDDILVFEEVRFVGFDISEAHNNKVCGTLRAFPSSYKAKTINEKKVYPNSISIRKDFFSGILERISKYGDHFTKIWFYIENGILLVMIQHNGSVIVFRDSIQMCESYSHLFFIPNSFVLNGGNNLIKRDENEQVNILYNKEKLRIDNPTNVVEFSQFRIRNPKIETFKNLFVSQNSEEKIVVKSESITSFIKRAIIHCKYMETMVFHISHGYMTMHCYDSDFKTGIHEYCSVLDGFNDINFLLYKKPLLSIIQDIDTPYIQILRLPNGLLYLSSINEDPFGNTLRIINPSEVKPEDLPYFQKESQALVKRFNPLS